MAFNGKTHREHLFQGTVFLSKEPRKYAEVCAQYLRKSTTNRGPLMESVIRAYVSLLKYAAGMKKEENRKFLGMPASLVDYPFALNI